jgi:hypothetical protein
MVHRERGWVLLLIAALCLFVACPNGGNRNDGNSGRPSPTATATPTPTPATATTPLIQEDGDAAGDCKSCQRINRPPPFIIQGEIRPETDVDCYCFEGKADRLYLIGVTGNNRRLTAQGPGDDGPRPGVDGLLEYTPRADGTICVCVSGGGLGAYLLTITPG